MVGVKKAATAVAEGLKDKENRKAVRKTAGKFVSNVFLMGLTYYGWRMLQSYLSGRFENTNDEVVKAARKFRTYVEDFDINLDDEE